jgi:hypothetical protein
MRSDSPAHVACRPPLRHCPAFEIPGDLDRNAMMKPVRFLRFSSMQYQEKPKLPFIPGNECSGVVLQVGHDVRTVSVGDKVGPSC